MYNGGEKFSRKTLCVKLFSRRIYINRFIWPWKIWCLTNFWLTYKLCFFSRFPIAFCINYTHVKASRLWKLCTCKSYALVKASRLWKLFTFDSFALVKASCLWKLLTSESFVLVKASCLWNLRACESFALVKASCCESYTFA